jgi:hypothetical protein
MDSKASTTKHLRISSLSSTSSGLWRFPQSYYAKKRSLGDCTYTDDEEEEERLSVVDENHGMRKRDLAPSIVESEFSHAKSTRYHSVRKLSANDFVHDSGPDQQKVREIHSRNMISEARRLARSIFRREKRVEEERERDSLDALEFDERPNPGYRYPLLEKLDPKTIRTFKTELEEAEQMRQEMNIVRESDRQILRPEPRTLVKRRLWGYATLELKKVNPRINHFLDATYEDLEQWLVYATVPVPNNRPLLKRINGGLVKAWSESYFFGMPKALLCMPSNLPDENSAPEEEDDVLWHLQDDVKRSGTVDPKKLSTTSSVTMFSTSSSKNPLYEEEEDEVEKDESSMHMVGQTRASMATSS